MAIALAATRPAEPFAEAKQRLAAALEEHRAEILDLSHRIHANPEPAFEEQIGVRLEPAAGRARDRGHH